MASSFNFPADKQDRSHSPEKADLLNRNALKNQNLEENLLTFNSLPCIPLCPVLHVEHSRSTYKWTSRSEPCRSNRHLLGLLRSELVNGRKHQLCCVEKDLLVLMGPTVACLYSPYRMSLFSFEVFSGKVIAFLACSSNSSCNNQWQRYENPRYNFLLKQQIANRNPRNW